MRYERSLTSPANHNLTAPKGLLLIVHQGLNVGGGGGATREIKIRLRRAGDEASFLHYESVLGTMLHGELDWRFEWRFAAVLCAWDFATSMFHVAL